jgi:hypothetical protein
MLASYRLKRIHGNWLEQAAEVKWCEVSRLKRLD